MKQIVIALLLCTACGKSGEERAREENAAMQDAAAKRDNQPAPPPPPPVAAKPEVPPAPEPTTPAEIDHARNQAMIDGRDKDVLKYCDLGKLDAKSSSQALLGCTLSACRIKDAPTAQRYAKALPKPLMDQAKKVCLTNQIGI